MKFSYLKIRTIVTLGAYLSIMIIMNFTPQFGYISLGGPNTLTLMLVPVILITLHYGWKGAIFGWTAFGILSIAATPIYSPSVLSLYGVGGTFVLYLLGRWSAMLVIILIVWLVRHKFKLNIWWQALLIGIFTPLANTTFVLGYATALNNTNFFALLAISGINIGVELGVSIASSIAMVPLVKYLIQKEKDNKQNEY